MLAEPIQQVMRRYGMDNPYEMLKTLTRGNKILKSDITSFIASLPLPESEKRRLSELTPRAYVGNAAEMAKNIR